MAELFFGEFRFDTNRLELEGPSGIIEVRPKTLELLTYLIQNRNRFVPRDELMQVLWDEVTVTASSLTQCVSELRHALQDSARDSRFIETKVKLGYRFAATVFHRPTEQLEPLPPPVGVVGPRQSDGWRGKAALLILVSVLIVVTTGAALWWMSSHPKTRPATVYIGQTSIRGLSPDDQALTENTRSRVIGGLAIGSRVTVLSGPIALRTTAEFCLETSCHRSSSDTLEFTAELRDLESGEAIWGWTWLLPDNEHASVELIAVHITRAIETRIGAKSGHRSEDLSP